MNHAEKIENALRMLRAEIKNRSALDWFDELSCLLNQTVPCPKCEGRGWNHKCRNCNHDQHDSWIFECYSHVPCKKCGAIGRVLKGSKGRNGGKVKR